MSLEDYNVNKNGRKTITFHIIFIGQILQMHARIYTHTHTHRANTYIAKLQNEFFIVDKNRISYLQYF